MSSDKHFQKLIDKVNELKNSGTYDLSMEEDLSLAVMNLISLEEHFFFSAQKTGKQQYYDLLDQTREIRKTMLERLISRHEGETWCAAKHLLAATMRLIEVGTKLRSSGNKKLAAETFDYANTTYSLFWALRLKLIKLPSRPKQSGYAGDEKLEDIINNLIDCCKE